MNAKTSSRTTKAPATRATGKATATMAAAQKPKTTQTAAKPARKSAATHLAQVAPPSPAEIRVTTPVSGRDSKQAKLIAMLSAITGATIEQMMTLTGWQAHTLRGTISGVLRKKLGLNVTCESADASGTRRYRIVSAEGV